MAGVGMSSTASSEDYLDQLNRVLPWHRSFTSYERLFIVILVSTFVSMVGCILLCILCSQSPLRRRRHYRQKKLEQRILIATAPKPGMSLHTSPPPPPRYESIVSTEALNKLNKSAYLDFGRKLSYENTSDSDGVKSNGVGIYPSITNGRPFRSQSARSSLSNGDSYPISTEPYPLTPYAQVNVALHIDTMKNLLIVHLKNGEHVPLHPAFDEHAEFFLHVQLLNYKVFQKYRDGWKKRRPILQWSVWKKLQEKTTKKLSRMPDNTLMFDEYLHFKFSKTDLTSTTLRLLLFCIDRSNTEDLMCEATIRVNPSMAPNYQQVIPFSDLPQITFAEVFLGISYLPTAERLTVKVNRLRYFCRLEKDEKLDARLFVTFFHHGRRFFQKRLPSILFDPLTSTATSSNTNVYDINETIIQNIPQSDVSSIYVHFELVLHLIHSKEESILSCGTILLGEQTRYRIDWRKILEQPRQIHLGWYQFFG